jgi:hypothetical protein
MGYDPTKAGDPIPRKFKNVVKCVANDIVTAAEYVARGRYQSLPEGVAENEPFWDLCFETLDARRTDGSPLSLATAGRLYTKEGKRQDNTQRPYRLSIAFAGMGISLFPGDPEGKHDAFCATINEEPIGPNPSYDASKVVGRVFLVEMEKMEIGRDMPLPITAEPEGYIYTGRVREVAPRADGGGVNPDGTAAPQTNTLVDVFTTDGAGALGDLLKLLDGQSADADLFDLLRAGGLDNRTLIDGESVLGMAVNEGALIAKLQEHGNLTVTDGRIAVSS